ncbi:MAG: substrate-binding periplasmic protein [Gammaproteobacteria bacterium]
MFSVFKKVAIGLGLASGAFLASAANYTIGVEQTSYYPIYNVNEKNEYVGFARELLDTFAKQNNDTFTYKIYPIPRLWEAFFRSEIDAKFPDNAFWKSKEKQEKGLNIVYSSPVLQFIEGIMVLPSNKDIGVEQLDSISLTRGFTAFGYLDLIAAKKVRVQEANDFVSAARMAIDGKAKGVYANIAVGNYTLKQLNKEGALVYNANLPNSTGFYYLSSIKQPALIEEFNKFLKDNASTVEELKKKYEVNH